MRKLFAILLVIMLMLISVVACQPTEDQQEDQNNEIIDEEDAKPDEDGDIDDENKEGNLGDEATLADGTYNAESGPDDRGYSAAIDITVENGKISTVEYDETNAEGVSKTEDEEYSQNMKEKSGISPAEAYEQLEEQLIEAQNVDEVDVVTGATSSTEKFKELAIEALPME